MRIGSKVALAGTGMALLIAGGLVTHAGPAQPSVEQARQALDGVRQQVDALVGELVPGTTATEGREAVPSRSDITRPPRTRAAAAARQVGERDPRENREAVRTQDLIERSLSRIDQRLQRAEQRLERNPGYAVHHVEHAARELRKVRLRLGLSPVAGEVQP